MTWTEVLEQIAIKEDVLEIEAEIRQYEEDKILDSMIAQYLK